jgi:uncharacterized RDD family membrane protein YckC
MLIAAIINTVAPAPEFQMIPPELQIGIDASGMPTAYTGPIPSKEEAAQMILAHWFEQLGNFAPLFLLYVLLPMIYFSVFMGGARQATPGMRKCGLKVTDRSGNPIGYGRAAWRTAAHFLTYLTLGLGFFAMSFNRRRLTLHDWLSGTEIRYYDPEFEAERKRRTEAAKEAMMLEQARALEARQNRQDAAAQQPASAKASRPHPTGSGKPAARPQPPARKAVKPAAKRPPASKDA